MALPVRWIAIGSSLAIHIEAACLGVYFAVVGEIVILILKLRRSFYECKGFTTQCIYNMQNAIASSNKINSLIKVLQQTTCSG